MPDEQQEDLFVEFSPKYNNTIVPDLHLVVSKDGKRYAGEEGSYCWDGQCGDRFDIRLENSIAIDRGSDIEFEMLNYRIPDEITAHIDNEPSLAGCTTISATEVRCGYPEGADPPQLIMLDDKGFRYGIDAPEGDYRITVGAFWKTPDGYAESDAAYYYKISVR